MALRILQFSTLFTIGYSLGIVPDSSLYGARNFPSIALSLNITDPKDVVVQRGQSATLRCGGKSSNGDIMFSWKLNGELLNENDSRWVAQSDGTLYIPKVYAGKKSNGVIGEYQCLVSNNDGALLSNAARLKVASIESEFSTQPVNQNVPAGQTLVLKCGIHSTPPVKIQWELNNVTLPHNNRYVPLPYGALIIHDSRISDSGLYRCKATNDLLKKTRYSKIAAVSVSDAVAIATPPSILPLVLPVNKTIFVGENLTLYCAVIGWPKATIRWLNDHNVVIGNDTNLNITEASKDDDGNYTCMAHNDAGHAKRQFYVAVLQKPRFIQRPKSKSAPPSRTVRLNCSAEGFPEPKIRWLKNGKNLNYSARITIQHGQLVFSHTFSNDSGFYQCVAESAVGTIWTAARILIKHHLQPSPPQNLQCRPYDSSSICLNWTAPVNVKAYSIYSLFRNKNDTEQWGPGAVVSNRTFYLIEGLEKNVNYTFYVLSFSEAASNPSNRVTCSPVKIEKRNIEILMTKPDVVLVKWNEMNKDKKCNGKRNSYKVQWREEGQESVYDDTTKQQNLEIKGLAPRSYAFRVSTISDPEPSWFRFVVPSKGNYSDSSVTSKLNYTHSLPMAPNKVEGVAKSGTSVLLNWANSDRTAHFFTICYFPLKNNKEKCDENNQLTSYKAELNINGLEPNTTYGFKVRAHSFNNLPGPYSQSVEIHTPEQVPSPVTDLNYKIINETAVCLHWQEPQRKNGKLKSYIISYTPDKNWPLENWLNISIPPDQQIIMNCWMNENNRLDTSHGTISMLLRNLSSETQYMVFVRAVSQVGIGDPTHPIVINTKIVDLPETASYKQKLGIILGTIIALVCILICIICLLLKRRCLKRRDSARNGLAASNILYPAVAHYATHADSVHVRLEDTCAQESQHLVQQNITANIPPMTSNFIDTKGGEEFPNGHLNGSAKPFMNGGLSKKPIHIRENPQYYAHHCNGHIGNRKTFCLEEDSNSNVKPSKFYSLHRLFENSKKAGTSDYNQCSASDNNDKNLQISDDETSNEYDNLNATHLTCLDDSLSLNVNNNKRIPPVLDPNG